MSIDEVRLFQLVMFSKWGRPTELKRAGDKSKKQIRFALYLIVTHQNKNSVIYTYRSSSIAWSSHCLLENLIAKHILQQISPEGMPMYRSTQFKYIFKLTMNNYSTTNDRTIVQHIRYARELQWAILLLKNMVKVTETNLCIVSVLIIVETFVPLVGHTRCCLFEYRLTP